MKDKDGKKIHIINAHDVANHALLKSQPATLLDLAPIQETLFNIGVGLHKIAGLLEDYESRLNTLETDNTQAQTLHPYGTYGLTCCKCGNRPRWVKAVPGNSGVRCWECKLGCGETPVRTDEAGASWMGLDLEITHA